MNFVAPLRIGAASDIVGEVAECLHAHRLHPRLFRREIGVAPGMPRVVPGVRAKHVAGEKVLRADTAPQPVRSVIIVVLLVMKPATSTRRKEAAK